jgi:hypothetical protein
MFGTQRTSLSGGNSKITRSDTMHTQLFIEVKMRVKHTAVTLWDDTKALADKEKKIPVVCLSEKNRPGFWVLCHVDDLRAIALHRRPDVVVEEKDGLVSVMSD